MSYQKFIILIISIVTSVSQILSDVPPPRIHKPDIPYFVQSLRFQTVQMRIFPQQISGMVTDLYSDLHWNPAYILRQTQKSVYLDFNSEVATPVFTVPIFAPYLSYENYSTEYMVLPRWYPNTLVSAVQTTPIYNIAALLAISPKISIGFINRSLFDYGPFRSAYWWSRGGWDEENLYLMDFSPDLEPQRLEIDDNQQTVLGTQSELIVGYKLSERIALGFRFGQYIFNRDGTLYDSKWAVYPHSSFADLNDESLEIDGNHLETGIGLMYHLGNKTRLGIYAGLTNGDGSEEVVSLDTSDSWWEKATDPSYYRISEYSLESEDSYSSTAKRPNMTFTFERDLSSKLLFRSFFYGSWSKMDITGSISSSDTTFGDRTYDVWDWITDREYFQRKESHSSRRSGLEGSGKENRNHWKWFSSLIYASDGEWSAFSGIQVQRYTFHQEFDETSNYKSHSWAKYTGFENKEIRNYYSHNKLYSVKRDYEKWTVFLPIGIKAKVFSGLYIILGTDVSLTLTDQDSEGKLLYPEKITRRWENGTLVVDDEEIDRYEEYSSDPAKNFNRSVEQRFGVVYEHPSGAKLFVRSLGDIFHTANWALGFEMNF